MLLVCYSFSFHYSLDNNSIGDSGVKGLGTGLEFNSLLRELGCDFLFIFLY